MLLRAAIVFLLVLNLGVAAWWLGGGNAPQPTVPLSPGDAPTLRLAGETAAAAVAKPPVVPAAVPATGPVSVQPADIAKAQCLRFGPFVDEASRAAASAALAAQGVVVTARDTAARAARGWKVHVPAFASREEARAMGERIKAAGISDWYVMNEGSDANSIALGRYGGEEAARRREAELRAKGIPAQAEPIAGTPAQAWLDARLPAGGDRAALAALAPAKAIDCATVR